MGPESMLAEGRSCLETRPNYPSRKPIRLRDIGYLALNAPNPR
jgi:hypothetical protein